MLIVGGYRVPLELPIELDETHRSTSEVMVDSLSLRGTKQILPVTRHHDLLGSTKTPRKKGVKSLRPR
jgi:hypothetical protein